MLQNKKTLMIGSSLAVALMLGGVVTYGLMSRAATPTDVAPAITCIKNQATANKATSYEKFTTDSIHYCYQGKGSTSKLMLSGSKYNSADYYRGPVGGGFTNVSSAQAGDFIFYQDPKFGQFPPPGSVGLQPTIYTLIGVAVGNGEMVRLNDTRTAVIKTTISSTFASTNPMKYKFLSGRAIGSDVNLRSFNNPLTLVPGKSTYTPSEQLEDLLLVNFFQRKGAPNYQQGTTAYGPNQVSQIGYIQNLSGTITGTGKDTFGQVGPYTWRWIYDSIENQPAPTGK